MALLVAAAAALPGRALEFASMPTMDAELLAFVEVLERFEGSVGLDPENVPYLEEALPVLTQFAAAPEDVKQSVISRLEDMARRRLTDGDFEFKCATTCQLVQTARRNLQDSLADRLSDRLSDREMVTFVDVLQRFQAAVALKTENVAFLENAVPVLIRFAAAAAALKQAVVARLEEIAGRRLGSGDFEIKCEMTCQLVQSASNAAR